MGEKYDWLVLIGAEVVPVTEAVRVLAQAYLAEGVLTQKSVDDAAHIAVAVVHGVDIVVSWNFKHIVHHDKITGYNAVAQMHGYKAISIHAPEEVISYD